MNLKEEVKNLPTTPGVYLYKDSQDNIIYVGKAKNLKRRVGSYFQSSKTLSPKVQKLLKHLKAFDYKVTDTEFEAFMLEYKLIKKYKPIYNKKMKNTQAYTYIVIQLGKKMPTIKNTRNPEFNESELIYGPYTSKNIVENALQAIKEYYQIMCSNPSGKGSLCLNYSLGYCFGMCLGGLAIEKYNNNIINNIIALLNGSNTRLLEELEKKMNYESKECNFEAAAKYRDYLNAINFLIKKGRIIEFAEEKQYLAVIEYLCDRSFKLFLIRNNKVVFREIYRFDKINIERLCTEIKGNMISQLKFEEESSPNKVNKEELDEYQIIYSYINSKNCKYTPISTDWVTNLNQTKLDEAINNLLSYQ